MLDAYNLNKEETDIREARQMTQPVVIQRLFILKETIEEEYLEDGKSQDSKTEGDTKSEELWGAAHFHQWHYDIGWSPYAELLDTELIVLEYLDGKDQYNNDKNQT